jgi:hypothetical protein
MYIVLFFHILRGILSMEATIPFTFNVIQDIASISISYRFLPLSQIFSSSLLSLLLTKLNVHLSFQSGML